MITPYLQSLTVKNLQYQSEVFLKTASRTSRTIDKVAGSRWHPGQPARLESDHLRFTQAQARTIQRSGALQDGSQPLGPYAFKCPTCLPIKAEQEQHSQSLQAR